MSECSTTRAFSRPKPFTGCCRHMPVNYRLPAVKTMPVIHRHVPASTGKIFTAGYRLPAVITGITELGKTVKVAGFHAGTSLYSC